MHISKEDLEKTHQRIKPYLHNTPVLTSSLINEMIGAKLYFKCENLQKIGSFKMRGALNAILQMSDEQKKFGVATHSSGNFAQALALAAKLQGTKAYIVMPRNALKVKKKAVKAYGGEIIECAANLTARQNTINKIVAETGAKFLHPYNDYNVIQGQGTAAIELFDEYNDLDYLLTSVGGGGLLAGTAIATYHFSSKTKVVAGEPLGADDAWQSLEKGEIVPLSKPKTIADGLLSSLGDKTFPIIRDHVEKIVRVEESEIIEAMRLIWERMKLIVEPSGAVALAAVIKEKEKYQGKKVGIIISGGNVDLNNLPF